MEIDPIQLVVLFLKRDLRFLQCENLLIRFSCTVRENFLITVNCSRSHLEIPKTSFPDIKLWWVNWRSRLEIDCIQGVALCSMRLNILCCKTSRN